MLQSLLITANQAAIAALFRVMTVTSATCRQRGEFPELFSTDDEAEFERLIDRTDGKNRNFTSSI